MMNTDTPNTTAAAVKERPILCQGAMVRAIREDRKTQTRRVVKVAFGGTYVFRAMGENVDTKRYGAEFVDGAHEAKFAPCPYGKPGERLWVRETFSLCGQYGPQPYAVFKDGGQMHQKGGYYPGLPMAKYQPGAFDHIKWKPSIHMPRWASRITLEVVGVRVERLQEISEEDAKAEGPLYAMDQEQTVLLPHLTEERNTGCVACSGGERGIAELCHPALRGKGRPFACWFASLWDSIHEEHTWEENPWVWVVEFRRVDGS